MRQLLALLLSLVLAAPSGTVFAQGVSAPGLPPVVGQRFGLFYPPGGGGGGGYAAPVVILADDAGSRAAATSFATTGTTASCPAGSTVVVFGTETDAGGSNFTGFSDSSGLGLAWTTAQQNVLFRGFVATAKLGASALPSGTTFTFGISSAKRMQTQVVCFSGGAAVAEISGSTHMNSGYGGANDGNGTISITAGSFASPPEWQVAQVITYQGATITGAGLGSWVHMTGGDLGPANGMNTDAGYNTYLSQILIQPSTSTSAVSTPPGLNITSSTDNNWQAIDAYVPSH